MAKVKSRTLRVRQHRAIATVPSYSRDVNENADPDDVDDEGNLEINREDRVVANELQNLDVEFESIPCGLESDQLPGNTLDDEQYQQYQDHWGLEEKIEKTQEREKKIGDDPC
ncbi:uncharacterized protein LOC117181264 [Belonocnema kinseyi]|uniref:uncharacterized protein LOC117181264 n=1 Tax=Belonocnema kinseyi TaxID=2817044 RepID=UPI00143DB02E|nr:uncharacterized protein LOC117181264 [Belonocnema kinseyi]